MNFMTVLFFVAALGAYGASPDADSLGQHHIRRRLGYQPVCTPDCNKGSTVYQSANGEQIKVSYFHAYPLGSKVEVKNLTTESSLLVRMRFGEVQSGRTKTLISYENKERNQQVHVTSSGPLIDGDNIGNIAIWTPSLRGGARVEWKPKISSLPTKRPETFGTIYTDEDSAEVTRYIFRSNASEGVFVRVRIPYANIYAAEFEWGTETYGKALGVEGATENVVGQRRVFIDEEPSDASVSEIPKDTKDADDTPKISAYSCTIQ